MKYQEPPQNKHDQSHKSNPKYVSHHMDIPVLFFRETPWLNKMPFYPWSFLALPAFNLLVHDAPIMEDMAVIANRGGI